MVTRRSILTFAALLLLGGCVSPAGWTLRLERKVECGMTVEEVQALTIRRVHAYSRGADPNRWQTHYVEALFFKEEYDVILGFEEERLRYVKVRWANTLISMASYPVIDLCADEDAAPVAATEAPS